MRLHPCIFHLFLYLCPPIFLLIYEYEKTHTDYPSAVCLYDHSIGTTAFCFPSPTIPRSEHLSVRPDMPAGEGVSAFRQYSLLPGGCHLVFGLRGGCIDTDTGTEQGTLCGTALTQRCGAETVETEGQGRTGQRFASLSRCIDRGGPRPAWRDSSAQRIL